MPASPEAFWSALDNRDEQQLGAMLRASPGLAKLVSRSGWPAIHSADTPQIVRLLVDSGADVNAEDRDGRTALQSAAASEKPERRRVALVLLQAGAHTNFKPGTIPALTRAAEQGDRELVEALLAAGAAPDGNTRDPGERDSPLIEAARKGHKEVIEALLAGGANPNHRGFMGSAALARAAQQGSVESVDLLLRYKADINAVDKYNETALGAVLSRWEREPASAARMDAVASLLRERGGIDPQRRSTSGLARPASQTSRAGSQGGASVADKVVSNARRAALALKYVLVDEDSNSSRGVVANYRKGANPPVTLHTAVLTRSNGSVRLTALIASTDSSDRREAIRQYRSVLLKLFDVDTPSKAGFELDGNLND